MDVHLADSLAALELGARPGGARDRGHRLRRRLPGAAAGGGAAGARRLARREPAAASASSSSGPRRQGSRTRPPYARAWRSGPRGSSGTTSSSRERSRPRPSCWSTRRRCSSSEGRSWTGARRAGPRRSAPRPWRREELGLRARGGPQGGALEGPATTICMSGRSAPRPRRGSPAGRAWPASVRSGREGRPPRASLGLRSPAGASRPRGR